MKQAIVTVYHGSTNETINKKTSTDLTKKVKAKFPNFDVFEVFSSKIVNHRLNNKRMDFKQCLTHLESNGYSKTYVLVTNLISGVELTVINDLLMESNLSYQISDALFDNIISITKIANILGNKNKDESFLFIGHGSKRKTNEKYLLLEKQFNELNYDNHYICVIDGKPTYDDIKNKLDTTKKLNIFPLMFTAGYHAKKDVKGLADALIDYFIDVEYHNISLGMIDDIKNIYLDNLEEMIKASI